ncbi:uncharacterized protein B0H64DRAFT_210932 [Chaetomium fimeti]|uniref:Uncharacterized protein n=1 Tax=Chaetomium fimeti TaxID=1854472 RepID=A0AAE0HBL9_9PEZI|nr:hypothetical protein B0H64DRAFT_210932 [Chaetomium fimeti]
MPSKALPVPGSKTRIPHTPAHAPLQLASPPMSTPPTCIRCVTSNTTNHFEMVVSISFPAPRMRASDWKSDLPVGDITGRKGVSAGCDKQADGAEHAWKVSRRLSPRRNGQTQRTNAGVRLRSWRGEIWLAR